jgi:hypothetical protein
MKPLKSTNADVVQLLEELYNTAVSVFKYTIAGVPALPELTEYDPFVIVNEGLARSVVGNTNTLKRNVLSSALPNL